MLTLENVKLIGSIALLLSAGFIAFSFVFYLKKYHIIQTIIAKANHKTYEYNRNRRKQLKTKLETVSAYSETKFSALEKIFLYIKKLGIMSVLPGFTETHILVLYIVLVAAISISIGSVFGSISGIFFCTLLLVATKILGDFSIHRKKELLEDQLTLFINACEGAAGIHNDIIDIIGEVYERMRPPLRGYLEECYIEAKTFHKKSEALKHLKEKTDSVYFESIIDNLYQCSEYTGNYRQTVDDIRGPIRVYQTCKKRKQALVRNARVNILTMTCIGLAIIYSAMSFFTGMQEVLFHSPIGIVLLGIVAATLLAGMTIKTS